MLTWREGAHHFTVRIRSSDLSLLTYEWEGPGFGFGSGEGDRREILERILTLAS
jgi:hypothetical protein